MKLFLLTLALCFVSEARANTVGNCRSVSVRVSATATNRNYTTLNLGNNTEFLRQINADQFPRIAVSGDETLTGIYCEPLVTNSNNTKLQVLFHSLAANAASWNALGDIKTGVSTYQPTTYSWTLYANNLGYPTLAMDRLGNGGSTRPDPVNYVQGPYEDALYHNLAQNIRAGTAASVPQYCYLIWIGNSFGSELGTTAASKYPNDWNQIILTGFSKTIQQSLNGISMVMPGPASQADPSKWGNLPSGYLTPTSQTGTTNAFFGSPSQVSFDSTVGSLFYQRRDTIAVGQFASAYSPWQIATASQYTGRVLVLTGEQDQPFCGLGSPTLGTASCGTRLRDAGSLFPAAQYNYQSINKTGHAVQFHTSSLKVFSIAHRFLNGERFAGGPI